MQIFPSLVKQFLAAKSHLYVIRYGQLVQICRIYVITLKHYYVNLRNFSEMC
jgi:hypothetical protein